MRLVTFWSGSEPAPHGTRNTHTKIPIAAHMLEDDKTLCGRDYPGVLGNQEFHSGDVHLCGVCETTYARRVRVFTIQSARDRAATCQLAN